MQTNYIVEKELRLLDIFIVLFSSSMAQRLVKSVPFMPDSPIIQVIVAAMPLVTYLVCREIARHSSALQPSDWIWALKRDWRIASGCLVILILGALFNSWVTLIPVVTAFLLHKVSKGYRSLNDALMGVFVYRFVWYLVAVVILAAISYTSSSSSGHLLGLFVALAVGLEFLNAVDRTAR